MIHMLGIFMTEGTMEKNQTPQTLWQEDQTFSLCTIHLYQCYGTLPIDTQHEYPRTDLLPVDFLLLGKVELWAFFQKDIRANLSAPNDSPDLPPS